MIIKTKRRLLFISFHLNGLTQSNLTVHNRIEITSGIVINSSVWSKGVYYLLTVEAVIIPKLLLRSIQVTGFYLEKGETITFKLLSLRYFFLVLFV